MWRQAILKYPRRSHFLLALALALLASVLLWWLFGARTTGAALLASWLVAVNFIAFAYYGYDKAQAGRARRRIPEAVLHGLAAVGGSPAALLAMKLFRHKTIAQRFRILFWCIVVLQTLLIAWAVKLHYAG
jgi:uncharacterized membrane protein YsdA (DUF1294 family)